MATAELVLMDWGYQLDRTELPDDTTRGMQAYAMWVVGAEKPG